MGLYRSGSSALSSVLRSLGVNYGDPSLLNIHLENKPLAERLRFWWDEPYLITSTPPEERQRFFREWLEALTTEHSSHIGGKHPLLSLCAWDLPKAWGEGTRLLWSYRNIDDSIRSLRRMNWGWPAVEKVQETLLDELERAEEPCNLKKVHYERLLESPETEIESLATHLRLAPTDEQWASAVDVILSYRETQTNKNLMRKVESKKIKIIATMLTGNQESLVEDAVKSVIPFVDEFLLLDTGITDSTANVVKEHAGSKFSLIHFPWPNNFATARNFALDAAAQRGGDWAFTVDSDERFVFVPGFSREQLNEVLASEPQVQAWMMSVFGGEYGKERLIRLPAEMRWKGATHETLVGYGEHLRKNFRFGYFWEPTKPPEAFRSKLTRDLEALQRETERSPHDPRWWYYLGQTYEGLRDFENATKAFIQCAELDGWEGESASAYFRAGMCLKELKRYRDAEMVVATGLSRAPRSAELFWLAGFCAFQLGAAERAIQWCEHAIQCGEYLCTNTGRRGVQLAFRHMAAYYEGPFDVIRFAYRQLGNQEKCEEAELHYRRAKRMREVESTLSMLDTNRCSSPSDTALPP